MSILNPMGFRPVIVSALLLALSGCVTETTGGFATEVSEGQALQDYINLAVGYYDAGDMLRARRNINYALDLDRNNSDVYNILALVMQADGDTELAEENFRRAIRLNRDNSRARNNFAALLFTQERFGEALEQLQRVTDDTAYEGRAIAFENLGRSALALERREEARRAFQRALQLNANLYISSLELAIMRFEDRDWSAARSAFSQYLTTAEFFGIPHTPRALLAGIQIEGLFQNSEIVDNFALILTTLYPQSPENAIYQELIDAN